MFLPLFLLRGMGGGDAKLMAAIGAITGWQNCFIVFLLTAILGGVLAAGLALMSRRFCGSWRTCVRRMSGVPICRSTAPPR
ncbi:MAG: prepilin peptidase [Acidobacteria bacterium]|nr:prepilin peptidase [Acidobacteriota bacterium]